MWQGPRAWHREVAFIRVQGTIQHEWALGGPGLESALGLGGRLVKCCRPGHSGGCSPSQLPAGGEPRPWPRVRLEQGSSVSGFENTPGNVLVEFSIYPGDNAF